MMNKSQVTELQNFIARKMKLCLTAITDISDPKSDENVGNTILALAQALDVLDYVETKKEEEE